MQGQLAETVLKAARKATEEPEAYFMLSLVLRYYLRMSLAGRVVVAKTLPVLAPKDVLRDLLTVEELISMESAGS